MIPADTALAAAWLPLSRIVVEQHEPRSLKRARFFVRLMRRRPSAHAGPPITVRPLPGGYYAILDGHHRFVAHIVAGRDVVPCTIVGG